MEFGEWRKHHYNGQVIHLWCTTPFECTYILHSWKNAGKEQKGKMPWIRPKKNRIGLEIEKNLPPYKLSTGLIALLFVIYKCKPPSNYILMMMMINSCFPFYFVHLVQQPKNNNHNKHTTTGTIGSTFSTTFSNINSLVAVVVVVDSGTNSVVSLEY